jgi:hypothetical protein
VNGSWMKYEHAQQASDGARNVITVASARGRYNKESAIVSIMIHRKGPCDVLSSSSQQRECKDVQTLASM